MHGAHFLDELADHIAEQMFALFERAKARRIPEYQPVLYSKLAPPWRKLWQSAGRGAAEIAIKTLIEDQRHALRAYDPIMGAAYEGALLRYAIEELGFNPSAEEDLLTEREP